ncbi:SelT/SelW/SelH family protein [Acidianus manzaensis]|uniref:Selenoprotein n=1 Tax=Acidianus manzaensis TaxID=282676 RepID=A0A1W6K3A5_9CREN|nr:Rdx family protein [Acidianus manzaensis]ARM77023.1 hypothetical protein B6F84_02165 [Acidianus manzaensis]
MASIKIVYCRPCGYLDRAIELARSILTYFDGISVELVQGKNGIFDVYIEDNLIFSRYEAKRFPEENEILKEIGKNFNK